MTFKKIVKHGAIYGNRLFSVAKERRKDIRRDCRDMRGASEHNR
nr:hypothetical protein [Paenibacillus larvae]